MPHRILMIDDDREMVALGELILKREGFEVISAYGGADGLEALKKEGMDVQAVQDRFPPQEGG